MRKTPSRMRILRRNGAVIGGGGIGQSLAVGGRKVWRRLPPLLWRRASGNRPELVPRLRER